MRATDYLRHEFAAMRQHVRAIVANLDDANLLAIPPGRANAVGATLLHVATGEDRLVRAALQGLPTRWDAGGWAARVGVATLPVRGHDWDGIDLRPLRRAALADYGAAVEADTDRYLATLDDDDLATPIVVYGREQTRAEALIGLVVHNISHAGEIAALRGVLGGRGRPT